MLTLIGLKEVKSSVHMTEDGSLSLVSEGNYLIEEVDISRLTKVCCKCKLKPESRVGIGLCIYGVPSAYCHTACVLISYGFLKDLSCSVCLECNYAEAVLNDITVAVITPTAPGSAEVGSVLAPEVDKTVKMIILCCDVVLCIKRLVVGLNLVKVFILILKVFVLVSLGIVFALADAEYEADSLLLACLKLHIKLH